MSEFCELKNKEILAILEPLQPDDITEIHENLKPSYLLRNVMLCAMAVLDIREDYNVVSIETRNPERFIASLKSMNYQYVSKKHLKKMHIYTKSKKFQPQFIENEGIGPLIICNWLLKLQELAMSHQGIPLPNNNGPNDHILR